VRIFFYSIFNGICTWQLAEGLIIFLGMMLSRLSEHFYTKNHDGKALSFYFFIFFIVKIMVKNAMHWEDREMTNFQITFLEYVSLIFLLTETSTNGKRKI